MNEALAWTIALRVPCTLHHLGVVRQVILDLAPLLKASGFDAEGAQLPSLALAVHEAATNAVRHGQGKRPLELEISLQAGDLVFCLQDWGCPNPDPTPRPPNPLAEGGYGQWIIAETMDQIHYQSNPNDGNRLTMAKSLAGSYVSPPGGVL